MAYAPDAKSGPPATLTSVPYAVSLTAIAGGESASNNGIAKLPLHVTLDRIRPHDHEAVRQLLNFEIDGGRTYPFEGSFKTIDTFAGYYLSHECFVLRRDDGGAPLHADLTASYCWSTDVAASVAAPTKPVESTVYNFGRSVIGAFYVKPNWPGRSGHVCNGGFLVVPHYRGLGVGNLLGERFLFLAKELGYRRSMFNLVYASNVPSVKIWQRLGYEQHGRVKGAARIRREVGPVPAASRSADPYHWVHPHVVHGRDVEYVDALQFTYDLSTVALPSPPTSDGPYWKSRSSSSLRSKL